MCQKSEHVLLAKKGLKNLSPGVGTYIPAGIKASIDGESLEDRRETAWRWARAGHQGTERGSSQPKQVREAEQQEGTLKGRLGPQPVAL